MKSKWSCDCGGNFKYIERQKVKCDRCSREIQHSTLSRQHDGQRAMKAEQKYWSDPDLL